MKDETNKSGWFPSNRSFNAATIISGYALSVFLFACPTIGNLNPSSWREAFLPPAMASTTSLQSLPEAEEQIIRLFEQSTPSVSYYNAKLIYTTLVRNNVSFLRLGRR